MIQAEKEIIGALLTDASRLKDITGITPEMFEDGRLGMMFQAYLDGAESYTDVMQVFKDAGRDEHLTKQAILELMDLPMTASQLKANVRIVRDEYRAAMAQKIMSESVKPSCVDQCISEVIHGLQGLFVSESGDKTLGAIAEANEGNYFKPSDRKLLHIGFKSIDEALGGIESGDVTIIAARPAVGKSAFALQVIRNLAREGKRVAYYNLEMNETQVYERFLAAESGLALNRIRLATNFLGNEIGAYNRANNTLKQIDNIVVISGSRSVDDLRANASEYDVIVVDYLQLLKTDGKRGANRIAEVGDISRGLKALAADNRVPVIALSQLNRASARAADKEPILADLRESGDLEQDASTVLMLWDLDDNNRRRKGLKIAKARNGENTKIELDFDGAHMTFTESDGFEEVDEDIPFD